jgi:drug/metabolite transporter (DMT)-like permease
MTGQLKSWGLLLVCNFIWAGQFVLVKMVQDEVGPVFATSFPMLLATLMLLPVAWPKVRARLRAPAGSPGGFGRGDVALFAIIGVFGQVIAQLFVTWGVRHSLASNAALISLALPVVTALMAFIVLRERMSPLRWFSFALALAGVAVCSRRDLAGLDMSSTFLLGNILILLAVMGSAFYNVFGKKLLDRFGAIEVLFYSYVAVALVLAPVTLLLEPEAVMHVARLSAAAWVGLLLLAFFQYFLSMVIFLTVLTTLDATQAALSNYLIPFFGVVLAWAFLGETLTPMMAAGGALVLASTLVCTAMEHRLTARTVAAAPVVAPET